MEVLNIHLRELRATRAQVGALIDSLSSPADLLWPRRLWPRMTFDRPLAIGAVGGHGPIRYLVEAYTPGESIRFRFTGPAGFDGFHGYELREVTASTVELRHTLKMRTSGRARLTWPLVYRPLHDALVEDSFATAEASLGLKPNLRPWSPWVRFLRRAISGGRAPAQTNALGGSAHRARAAHASTSR